jgi:CRP-like cAMP-binding protein
MAADGYDVLGPLIRKLERLAELNGADRRAVAALPFTMENVRKRDYLVRDGEEAARCAVLVTGHACRHKTTRSGGRQIVSFHMSGDILNLQQVLLPRADHNVEATTDATVAWVPSPALKTMASERPTISEALWRDTLIDASIFREWVLNVGRRNARARVAHMLCEFTTRMEAAGLGAPESFCLPMSQEQIADATGLSAVHVNRTLHALQAQGALAIQRGQVRIVDSERMRSIAEFDPAYLQTAA